MRTRIVLLVILLQSSLVMAQEGSSTGNTLIAPTLFHYSGVRARNSRDEKSLLLWELKAAYQVSPNIFVGLSYQNEEETIKTSGYSDPSLNYSTKGTRISWGPTVGYVLSDFHAFLTYYYNSQWKLSSATSTSTTDYLYTGAGIQIDLGYKIPLLGGFFGPQLSYKNYTYSKLKTGSGNDETITPTLKETRIDPSFVFFFYF